MKLPRWLVWLLNGGAGLALLGLAAWLWIVWPEQSLRSFWDLVYDGAFEQANKRLVAGRLFQHDESIVLTTVDGVSHKFTTEEFHRAFQIADENLSRHRRSMAEIFSGRYSRSVSFSFLYGDDEWPVFTGPEERYEFTAEHGKISVKDVGF
jgi:hypothetical protein